MFSILVRLICLLIGYAFGLIQTGYLYGKLNQVDIRKYGSGNAGTTNALRTLGWKAGAVTLLGDACKCILAVVVVHLLFGKLYGDIIPTLAMYAGMGAVLGHNYPFYMNFKGGKGIACTAGLIISTTNIWIVCICIALFAIIVYVTRYVSVGSLETCIVYLIFMIYLGQTGALGVSGGPLYEIYVIAALLLISAVYKHKANIKRLMNGTENKLSAGKKEDLEKK